MPQDRVIAIFGAGIGLGAALARHFGVEGYKVALVARRAGPLEELAHSLSTSGINATAFPADVTDLDRLPRLLGNIEDRLGPIDVAVYAPVPSEGGFMPAAQLDGATLRAMAPLYNHAPVELTHRLIAGMTERASGAVVVTGGLAAVTPIPGLSGAAPLMAATRNYVHALNAELAGTGVFVGAAYIGAMIEGSTGMSLATAGGKALDPNLPTIAAGDVAAAIWSLVTDRDRVETVLPDFSR